jgi:hypothetical protein
MPIPQSFTDDPQTEKLASYFSEIYEFLIEEGVPEDRIPSPWHVLSRVVKCIDTELLREWLDAYVRMEAEPEEDDDEEESTASEHPTPKKPPRHRPSYLRALEQQVEVPEPEPGA